jgi:hypothetical protein
MNEQGRPTATVRRVRDLSVPRRRASAVPASPEDALFRAYGNVEAGKSSLFRVTDRREEPCACGGVLTVTGREVVEAVVQEHNETPLHVSWRAWRERLADE